MASPKGLRRHDCTSQSCGFGLNTKSRTFVTNTYHNDDKNRKQLTHVWGSGT